MNVSVKPGQPHHAVIANAFVRLNQLAGEYEVIPFVLPIKNMGCAITGYAAKEWVIDLFAWSFEQPLRQHHRIAGLLLGYSADAIAEHDAREFAGNPVVEFALSPMGGPMSRRPPADNSDTE